DWNDPDGDIFIYYISKETQTPAAEGGGYQYDPVVCSDKYMVYGEKNGNGLYLYDMGTKETETIFMQDQEDQDCSNTYVVWRERKTDKFLYLYEISDKTTEKIRDTIKLDTNNEIVSPSTDGNYVVWGEENFNEKDIYLYEISTNTTTMISDNETFDSWPDISGNKVIWIQGEPGSMDIIVYDTVSKTRKALGLADFGLISQPRINGNMIAWTGCRSDKYRVHYSESGFTITMSCIDFDVYAYNLNREELHVVETSTDEQRHAEVYGKNIVWHGWDRRKNNKPKIYMKTIQTTATPIIPQEMVLSS
ncbi:MAG: hypothetical protein GTN76_09295, partial [Candidatus Aenigmarchaeota archaeon]|nr:hypothetical protein [Candidatus Aenigmarchaeota archaeon]NIP40264.1 hypothetical protein [Candidatus Aenigmarchaeota archaeon]